MKSPSSLLRKMTLRKGNSYNLEAASASPTLPSRYSTRTSDTLDLNNNVIAEGLQMNELSLEDNKYVNDFFL
jgi:hypothetical protein